MPCYFIYYIYSVDRFKEQIGWRLLDRRGLEGMSGNGERDEIQTASYRNSYWDVKHSIGNLVSSIVITMVSDGN